VWKRFLTIFAGPAMNFVLAYLALAAFFLFVGIVVSSPNIGVVEPGMPAEIAGLRAGDLVTSANGQPIENSEAGAARLSELIGAGRPESPVTLTIDRAGQKLEFTIAPQETPEGRYRIGIVLGAVRHSPGGALSLAGVRIWEFTGAMVDGLKGLIFRGEGAEDAMGPVGIIGLVTQEISRDFEMVVYLIVIISLNVGIINLLPLPALDGGRLAFLAVEGIRRKPVKPEYEGWVHAAGFVLLLGLILVLTYRDIVRQVTGG